MPLTNKGETIKREMEAHYGQEKGEEVFYASANKGTISGVDGPKSADENVTPNGPLPERNTGAPPGQQPWGGLPQQVTQEETLARVNERSPWL